MVKITKKLTPAERDAYYRKVARVEVPETRAESDEYFRLAEIAAAEQTFSGELRRAVHSVHERQMFLQTLLDRAGVDWETLRPFMIGEASLPSAVIDRLAEVLELHLHPVSMGGDTFQG